MTALDRVLAEQPGAVALAIARGRMLIGMLGLLSARRLLARALRHPLAPSDEAVAALRMVSSRDLALGLGAELAARRGPSALRGWIEAGGLVDATDVVSLGRARTLRPAARWGGVLLAAVGAVVSNRAARNLT
jgi:hypothetical protein